MEYPISWSDNKQYYIPEVWYTKKNWKECICNSSKHHYKHPCSVCENCNKRFEYDEYDRCQCDRVFCKKKCYRMCINNCGDMCCLWCKEQLCCNCDSMYVSVMYLYIIRLYL